MEEYQKRYNSSDGKTTAIQDASNGQDKLIVDIMGIIIMKTVNHYLSLRVVTFVKRLPSVNDSAYLPSSVKVSAADLSLLDERGTELSSAMGWS